MHKHHAVRFEDYGWTGCIDPFSCDRPAAHGNIVRREVCRCGAVRWSEINGGAEYSAGWRDEDEDEDSGR